MAEAGKDKKGNIIRRLWTLLWRPTSRYSIGILLGSGMVVGVLLWGSFNWAMDLSNSEKFCISCHEMKDNVYQELKKTVHFSNTSGVRAICSDCHVPKQWIYKVIRKIKASNEIYHKIMGTIDTREKFEANRLELARSVWATMKATDSRECRNCHLIKSMKLEDQVRPARKKHKKAMKEGITCIECHQGIAHQLPKGWDTKPAKS